MYASNMKKYLYFLLFLCLFVKISFAKDTQSTAFDSAFLEISTDLAAQDIGEAILAADSLLKTASNSLEQTKGLMLLATLKEAKGDIADALNDAYAAEKIAIQDKNTEWQMRIAGYMSSTFQNIGLVAQGRAYLRKVETLNQQEEKDLLSVYIQQDKAFYLLDEKKPELALKELSVIDSLMLIPDLANQNVAPRILATSYQLKGLAYLQLNESASAKESLYQALDQISDESSVLSGFIYVFLAKAFGIEKNEEQLLSYLEKATPIAERANNHRLKIFVNEEWFNYYNDHGPEALSYAYENKLLKLRQERALYTKQISNQLIEELNHNVEVNAKKSGIQKTMITILILIFLVFIIYYVIDKRKQEKKYRLIINKIQEEKRERSQSVNEFKEEVEKIKEKEKKLDIPEATIETVLKEMEKFERGNKFLRNDISLSYVANQFKVNSKYVSQIINFYKEKDFNNYINELRIKYIINKLVDDDSYLNYKIAYLADETGFSSHSKFSSVFKQITGTSPSVFIQKRKKEMAKK